MAFSRDPLISREELTESRRNDDKRMRRAAAASAVCVSSLSDVTVMMRMTAS